MNSEQTATFNVDSLRKIMITCALPYANRGLHLGHLVEHFMADFWTRYHRMKKREVHFLCADDTHGTPVMIEARDQGITPEQLIANVWKQHTDDFRDFGIEYSHYSSTNSQENRELCETFYKAIKSAGHITSKAVTQFYCEHDKMFLPDRFVKGTCPRCGTADQYGDNCENCGATYSTQEVKNPYCSLCRNTPVEKDSDHLMFKLQDFREFLLAWLPQHTGPEMAKKMLEWFKEPLRDWDISRDAPYFGFKIPGYENKYFYVWVDAPMGYVSTAMQLAKMGKLNFDEYWRSEDTEVHHFIGKDIVYFHTLFWPALLKAAGFRTPTQVHVHGMLSINGEKMSKSKGTMISMRSYLNHLDPQHLRYYFASKLNSSVDDFDWAETDFVNRVNSDLVGKITNLGSRGAQMLGKKLGGKMTALDADGAKIVYRALEKAEEISKHYEDLEFAKVIQEVRTLADETNKYFDEKAPWKTVETDPEGTSQILTSTLNLFRILTIYLKPILPKYAEKVEKLFQESTYTWDSLQILLLDHQITDYEHLATRVDPDKVKAMMLENAAPAPASPLKPKASSSAPAKPKAKIPESEVPEGSVVLQKLGDSPLRQGIGPMKGTQLPPAAKPHVQQTLFLPNQPAPPTIPTVVPLVMPKEIPKVMGAGKATLPSVPGLKDPEDPSLTMGFIDIEQFSLVDLRVARIISAEAVPEADKLLKLELDLGPIGKRQVFAGIKAAYDPTTLVGRLTIVVANLKPRKMKFGMSEGMVLAAGSGGSELFIFSPDEGAKPGDRVK
jgi:methionyl-tRNA synthetase